MPALTPWKLAVTGGVGIVAAVHRILHRIAQDQQQNQVEWSELPDLPFTGEPQQQQDQPVDEHGPQHELGPGNGRFPHEHSPRDGRQGQ